MNNGQLVSNLHFPFSVFRFPLKFMLNLAVLLEDSAREVPERVAVICGAQEFTYAEINARANQVANALKEIGIAPGDKVALSCPNLPFFPRYLLRNFKDGRGGRAAQRTFEGTRDRLSS